ncbi:AraC family transcriptional regulator [Massilia litorea]|jgi:AraC-like DNA-binding protein|uniref:AraC family transcriptional regulator n=1 Tax=Massilia litorea TaxID=2769491 RepID=A0A7L9U9S7_9BURK|nr:AraC family transcriptional regulator [Massilia litorea]QOL51590.1 AraC family transcriptional regulator [Massilia litorea]
MDKLSSLLGRQAFSARIFYNGPFCDANQFHENGSAGHLHLVRQGPVEFVHDDGALLRIDLPSLVLYPHGTNHRLQVPAGHTALLLCADIVFEGGKANPLVRVLPGCLHMPLAEIAGLGPTLDLLFGEAAGTAPGRELILDRLCDVLLVQVVRREFDNGKLSLGLLAGLADRQVSAALTAIHERPHELWTLAALARLAGMSRASFVEHFREVMGIPPGEYLSRWRIALGGRLLRQGMPVKLVSSRTGYTSPSTFTRAFTAQMGASPREWLKRAA